MDRRLWGGGAQKYYYCGGYISRKEGAAFYCCMFDFGVGSVVTDQPLDHVLVQVIIRGVVALSRYPVFRGTSSSQSDQRVQNIFAFTRFQGWLQQDVLHIGCKNVRVECHA